MKRSATAVMLGALVCAAFSAVALAQGAVTFPDMLVLPTDVRLINYPADYQNAKPATVTVADPYCAIATDTVAFPADYLGAFPLPEIKGAPFPPNIRRGVSVKDYWDFGRTDPSDNVGCGGDIQTAFAATVDRLARLGVDHVNMTQWMFLVDGARPELGFVGEQMTEDDLKWIAATAASRGLKVHLKMQIAGYRTGSRPPDPIPLDWATRFLDAYSDYSVAQVKTAAAAGLEAYQLDFIGLTPYLNWSQQRELWLAKMKALADRLRSVFPGKIFYGQSNPYLIDADLMSRIDWIELDPAIYAYTFPPLDNDNLTVADVKARLLSIWGGIAQQIGTARKPVRWLVFTQSHRNYLKSGWIEDGHCVDNCMQQSIRTDFSVQAVAYEAYFEAIREQTFFETASVDAHGYWYVDVILPKDSFPNISQSPRNKPAEAILAAWFKPTTVPLPVVEFYNASLDHYFITWVPDEITKLDAGTVNKGWTRTGQSFKTYTAAQTGTSPVCRFYIPPALGDSHFFGRGTAECDATGQKNPSFVLESPDFMQMFLPTAGACPINTTQVYRVFSNRPDANHRYMIDKAIRGQMAAKGWLVEGDGPDLVVMCAPQ